jgi:hypothetical protein
MSVRLSALRAGRPLPPGIFLVLISVRGWVDSRAIVRLQGLGKLKISSSTGFDPATIRLVAQCLHQLRYRVPHFLIMYIKKSGFSPPANYADRATAVCRRSWCQLSRIESVAWSAERIPTAVYFGFLDRRSYCLSSSSSIILTRLSGPRSRPTTS